MARPRAQSTKKIVPVRMTDEDKAKVEMLADQAGLTTSEYVRRCALGKRLHSKLNVKAMAELNRLGGLQKLCITLAPEYRPQLNAVIVEIMLTLKSLRDKGI
jgi:hypothetical protein